METINENMNKKLNISKNKKFVPPLKANQHNEIIQYESIKIDNCIGKDNKVENLENYSQNKRENNISINGLVLNSYVVLDDDETLMSQDSLHISQKDSHQCQEISTVVPLNKTFKNMDMTSYENLQINNTVQFIENNNIFDNNSFSNNNNMDGLFSNNKINFNKMAAMSIQYGDIGLYRNYIDYVKQNGFLYQNNDIADIVEMFPNENRCFF